MSALIQAYTQKPKLNPVDRIIISHFDAHGVAFAAARHRVLTKIKNEQAIIVTRFPETGPQGLSDRSLLRLVEQCNVAPTKAIEMIDIPVDARNPEASIRTLIEMKERFAAPLLYYDHHETDVAFIPRLIEAGIISLVSDNITLAAALELLQDPAARELSIIGMVADRDRNVLRLASRQEVERLYLPLANKLDVLVRNPELARPVRASCAGALSDLAEELGHYGKTLLEQIHVDYPPYTLAREIEGQIVQEGTISLLVDWSNASPQHSAWIPKTLEALLQLRGKQIAICIAPGYDPRTRSVVGYDVRILKYWLAGEDVPTPEDVVKDLIAQKAISGQVVGHADYVSLRYSDLETARRVAEIVYRRIEGQQAYVTRLISDTYVAEAIRRDFTTILQKLTEILEQQKKMYEEYLELKRRQVELLERTQRHEYD